MRDIEQENDVGDDHGRDSAAPRLRFSSFFLFFLSFSFFFLSILSTPEPWNPLNPPTWLFRRKKPFWGG